MAHFFKVEGCGKTVTLDTAGKCKQASPVSVLCADVEWVAGGCQSLCFLCRVNQTDLTGGETVHRHTPACEHVLRVSLLCVWSGCVFSYIQNEQISLEMGKHSL